MSEFWTDPRFSPTIWGIVPQFGKMSSDERTTWQNTLQDEFNSLWREHKIRFKPIWLYPTVELRIQNVIFALPEAVTKGLGVRLAAATILYEVDRDFGQVGRRSNWILMVDGTGSYVGQVKHIVERLNSWPVVLGRRIGYQGMSEDRVLIETFEKRLLKERYDQVLDDCQAGIWGIRLDVLEAVSLTASEYGLEFDLVAGLLEAGIRFSFADVTVNSERSVSTFDPEESIKKLRFIGHRLDISEDKFRSLLTSYTESLPEAYLKRINHILGGRAPHEYPLFHRREQLSA